MLTDLLHALDDPARPAQAHFLADEFVTSEGEVHAAAFPDLFAIWTRVHKAGLLIGRMRIDPEELTWLIRHGDGLELLDWNALPVADAEVFPALYPGWERLADLLALRPTVVSPDASLFALLEQPLAFDPAGDLSAEGARDRFLADLAAATGWDGTALQFLAGDDGFALTYPVDFLNGAAIRKMARCGALARSLGVSEATLFEWTSPGVTPQQAEDMKAALKAKYDREQWLRIAHGINDVLREERRDALVALLIARNSTFQDANDLYARLLIDPEMSSCMLTSRIKQAISSAQLFVQRVLFGLEGDEVTLAPAAGARWRASMKHYRVWEASRLIFVYPENWLEPDLRDDKTPLFRELENDLLQGELSASQLRGVLGRYLTGLQTVANLEMVGVHTEYGPGARPTHVFARTRSAPHTYYYRRWDFPARWTAWERMDVDVGDGEHLLPVVANGQLFLFWLAFSEQAEEGDPPAEGESERPEKSVEIKLAWSEYKDGAWQAKKESTGRAITQAHEGSPDEAAATLGTGAVTLGVLKRVPVLVPLAVMASSISAYDDEIERKAFEDGDFWAELTHPIVGAAAASASATGRSVFEGTFGVTGRAIGEGAAVLIIRATSDDYTLVPWKSQIWSDIFD